MPVCSIVETITPRCRGRPDALLHNMAASITVHLQIFKRLQLLRFLTDLDETGIKIHGLLRSFIQTYTVNIRVAVPFKSKMRVIQYTDELVL